MIVILVLIILVLSIVYYVQQERKRALDYFKNKGIVAYKPKSILTGLLQVFTKNLTEIIDSLYVSYPNEKLFGFFDNGAPIYFLRDPQLIKQLAIKDFDHFMDHRAVIDRKHDTFFGNMLISLEGKKWREMRSSLSPAFTGSKMRMMFELVAQCGIQFCEYFNEQYQKAGPQSYDIKDIYLKFTNDVIATCAFGVKCDSLRDPDNTFLQVGKQFLTFPKPLQMLKFLIMRFMPKISLFFNMQLFDEKSKSIFTDIISTTMKTREKENIIRPDMINLLMDLKKGHLKRAEAEDVLNDSIAAADDHDIRDSGSDPVWTDEKLVPQCFIFFLAGLDTSSTLMAFTAYELAVNPDIQSRLLNEIDEINTNLAGKPLTYNHLQNMKFLDMIVAETLRKWPPVVLTDRQCTKNYTYEDQDSLKFTIDKGSSFWIPIFSLHRDAKYFPNPENFDPMRFSDENKSNIDFNCYLPFGVGPRNCIGSRFALMEAKVVIYYLLLNFTFAICEKTQIPLKLKKKLSGMVPEKIELMLQRREI